MTLQELPDNLTDMTSEQLIAWVKANMPNIEPWENVAEWFLHAYGSNFLKDGQVPSWAVGLFRAELIVAVVTSCDGGH